MKSRYSFPLFTFAGYILMCMTAVCPVQAASQPPADVIHEARHFIPNAVYKKTIWTEKGTYYEFGRNHHRVLIDMKTGKANYYTWSFKSIKGRKNVDQKTAETRVRAWLKDRKIDLTGWTLLEKNTYGDNHLFYFGKKTSDGIILNSHLNVTMDTDGNFLSYLYTNNPITVSLKPKYSKKELIDIAFKEAKLKNAKLKSFGMGVADRFGDIEKQMLLATVWLKGDTDHPQVCGSGEIGFIINAHTGEVITSMGH